MSGVHRRQNPVECETVIEEYAQILAEKWTWRV
jgi:hypothetical protein